MGCLNVWQVAGHRTGPISLADFAGGNGSAYFKAFVGVVRESSKGQVLNWGASEADPLPFDVHSKRSSQMGQAEAAGSANFLQPGGAAEGLQEAGEVKTLESCPAVSPLFPTRQVSCC